MRSEGQCPCHSPRFAFRSTAQGRATTGIFYQRELSPGGGWVDADGANGLSIRTKPGGHLANRNAGARQGLRCNRA